MKNNICLSVVSHGHAQHILSLVNDLCIHKVELDEIRVISNIPENLSSLNFFNKNSISIYSNPEPIGFGENHNRNLSGSSADYYLIINPDVRLTSNPIPELLRIIKSDPTVGLIAPKVVNSFGNAEDNIRRFPSLYSLFKKAFGYDQDEIVVNPGEIVSVPWVAGMFMLIRRDLFESLGGFDEGFYLYYEDVDLCARIHLAGFKVCVSGNVTVVHDAQRDSRRRLKFMIWHVKSLMRYFLKYGIGGKFNEKC